MDSAILSEMIETRRRLHQHPEEGWTEFETTWLVYNRLKALGCESVLTGTRLINPDCVLGRSEALVEKAVNRAIAAGVPAEFIDEIEGYTGAAAVIDTGRPGPVLALRFDMDALCVEETTDPEHLPNKQGFCSQYAGLMHACGHDAHTALGLAVARWIMENRKRLTGVIKLIISASRRRRARRQRDRGLRLCRRRGCDPCLALRRRHQVKADRTRVRRSFGQHQV